MSYSFGQDGSPEGSFHTARSGESFYTAHSNPEPTIDVSNVLALGLNDKQLDVSFVFVVNEVHLKDHHLRGDQSSNAMPPKVKSAYGPETVGRVFRFANGTVQPEPKYYWHRPGQGQVGRIGRMIWHEEKDGNQTKVVPTHFIPIPQYKIMTVFDCGTTQPCIYTESDVTATDLQSGPWPEKKFWPLAFQKTDDDVSRVVRGGVKQAAGSNTSWVGTLVPETFKNQEEDAKPSKGLGGDLGPLLGLMALAEPAGQGDDAFKYHWQHCQWKGRRQASLPSDKPIRGVIVHIALDRDEMLSQNWDNLIEFEKNGIAIEG